MPPHGLMRLRTPGHPRSPGRVSELDSRRPAPLHSQLCVSRISVTSGSVSLLSNGNSDSTYLAWNELTKVETQLSASPSPLPSW